MILKVYSVFDSALATFDRPWYALTDAAAIRVFTDAVNRQGSDERPNGWYDHPEDFSLYCLGVFDDQLGTIVSDHPERLILASSIFDRMPVNSAQLDMFDVNGSKKVVSSK